MIHGEIQPQVLSGGDMIKHRLTGVEMIGMLIRCEIHKVLG